MNKSLDRQIEVYEEMIGFLEAEHFAKWVVIHDEQFIGAFEEIEEAARVAYGKFGYGPYLIRQVGAPPMRLRPLLPPMRFMQTVRFGPDPGDPA